MIPPSINKLQFQSFKKQLNIESSLTINFTLYQSGSKQPSGRGRITEDAFGEIKQCITGSGDFAIVRLIYKDMATREPTILVLKKHS